MAKSKLLSLFLVACALMVAVGCSSKPPQDEAVTAKPGASGARPSAGGAGGAGAPSSMQAVE